VRQRLNTYEPRNCTVYVQYLSAGRSLYQLLIFLVAARGIVGSASDAGSEVDG